MKLMKIKTINNDLSIFLIGSFIIPPQLHVPNYFLGHSVVHETLNTHSTYSITRNLSSFGLTIMQSTVTMIYSDCNHFIQRNFHCITLNLILISIRRRKKPTQITDFIENFY